MKKTELNDLQLGQLNLFNLILECNGWEDNLEVEKRLDRGENVKPEGIRNYVNDYSRLEAQFHAPVYMLSLSITDKDSKQNIHLFFFYDDKPHRILEWLVSIKDQLTFQTYAPLLKQFKENYQQAGDTILLTDSPSTVYELASTNSH